MVHHKWMIPKHNRKKQEMSQKCDECPQRNRSCIRHILVKLFVIKKMIHAPDMKILEMRSEVNDRVKVTKNGMHHSTIPGGIHTPTSNNIGYYAPDRIILETRSQVK